MDDIMDETPSLTCSQIAGTLGVTRTSVGRWVAAGKLRGVRHGREYRVAPQSLREFLERDFYSDRQPSKLPRDMDDSELLVAVSAAMQRLRGVELLLHRRIQSRQPQTGNLGEYTV